MRPLLTRECTNLLPPLRLVRDEQLPLPVVPRHRALVWAVACLVTAGIGAVVFYL
jgi:hypothetical protein